MTFTQIAETLLLNSREDCLDKSNLSFCSAHFDGDSTLGLGLG